MPNGKPHKEGAFVPNSVELTAYDGPGRVYTNHEEVTKGVGIPVSFLGFYNWLGKSMFGPPKKKPDLKKPGEGGTMEYESDIFKPGRADVMAKAYELFKGDCPVIEKDIYKLSRRAANRFNTNYLVKGMEDGRNVCVAKNHPDGRSMDNYSKLKAGTHEKVGLERTLAGIPHMVRKNGELVDNDGIHEEADSLLHHYVSRALRELCMN